MASTFGWPSDTLHVKVLQGDDGAISSPAAQPVMRSRSTLCEVPLEDIWRRPVPSSKAGRGEVCSV